MASLHQLLKEIEPVRDASTAQAAQAFVAALWRRSNAEIADLSIQFADARLLNAAAMCRSIATARAKR